MNDDNDFIERSGRRVLGAMRKITKNNYNDNVINTNFLPVIDHCVSSPCLNNGQCTSLREDFVCECAPGYRGKRCQEEKNECFDEPCYGNAACIDKVRFCFMKHFQ